MHSAISTFRTLLLAAVFAVPITVQAQLTENFDDVSALTLADWYFQNNSDPLGTTGWFQGNPAIFTAQNGADDAYIAANFQNVDDVGTISNWMLTPELVLEDGAVFSFFTRVPTDAGVFPDRLELRLSTAGASTDVGSDAFSVGEFDLLLLSVNPNLTVTDYPNDWTQFSVTLSGIGAPATGRFGFRYFVTDAGDGGSNGDYIGIDAVSYTAVSVVPEPASLAMTGVGLFGLALLQRRRVS